MPTFADEIKSNMENALAHLQAARDLLEGGQYGPAAGRAAQAAFHAGTALLLDAGIEPARHGDVITLLHQVFVQGRQLTKEQGGNLSWLFAFRGAMDREATMHIPATDAGRAVQIAEGFLAAARVILEG